MFCIFLRICIHHEKHFIVNLYKWNYIKKNETNAYRISILLFMQWNIKQKIYLKQKIVQI